jgi:hypothetical protein
MKEVCGWNFPAERTAQSPGPTAESLAEAILKIYPEQFIGPSFSSIECKPSPINDENDTFKSLSREVEEHLTAESTRFRRMKLLLPLEWKVNNIRYHIYPLNFSSNMQEISERPEPEKFSFSVEDAISASSKSPTARLYVDTKDKNYIIEGESLLPARNRDQKYHDYTQRDHTSVSPPPLEMSEREASMWNDLFEQVGLVMGSQDTGEEGRQEKLMRAEEVVHSLQDEHDKWRNITSLYAELKKIDKTGDFYGHMEKEKIKELDFLSRGGDVTLNEDDPMHPERFLPPRIISFIIFNASIGIGSESEVEKTVGALLIGMIAGIDVDERQYVRVR